MPRKQRIEFPGATYHIISRGNYRKNLFTDEETINSFETSIFQTVERCGWTLHAYVIMRNHYHLAVHTPDANLVAGMKWLQSTFATRFNRFHNERGHVFQGRYKSLFVTEDAQLRRLIDYIHLNPVRARICQTSELETYQPSSFAKLWTHESFGKGLMREQLLPRYGLPVSLQGMQLYRDRLAVAEERNPRKRKELSKQFCQGWFLGSKEARSNLAEKLLTETAETDLIGSTLRGLRKERWDAVASSLLERLKKTAADIAEEPKGASWKVEIARRLRKETTASNPWIAERLNMGHPNHVSFLINRKDAAGEKVAVQVSPDQAER